MPTDQEIMDYLEKKERENPSKIDEEVKIVKDIQKKYNVDVKEVTVVTLLLMKVGFGRNSHTANLLRAIAEIIECSVQTRDTIVAEMEGKLQ